MRMERRTQFAIKCKPGQASHVPSPVSPSLPLLYFTLFFFLSKSLSTTCLGLGVPFPSFWLTILELIALVCHSLNDVCQSCGKWNRKPKQTQKSHTDTYIDTSIFELTTKSRPLLATPPQKFMHINRKFAYWARCCCGNRVVVVVVVVYSTTPTSMALRNSHARSKTDIMWASSWKSVMVIVKVNRNANDDDDHSEMAKI